MFIPVGEYAPDQPTYRSQSSGLVQNALPRSPVSYGPMPSLSAYSTALTERAQGATVGVDTSGNVAAFAGSATKLWRLAGTGTAFSDVSGATYTTAADGFWKWAQFGSRIIATNYSDAIQSYVMGSSSTFSDLAVAAPKAKHLAVVRDWLFAANTYDSANGVQTQRVWWPALNDPTNWPTPGTSAASAVQSDYQDLPGDHGEIMAVVGNLGTADAAVFLERAVYRVVYQGSPTIFSFQPAEGLRGTPAANSVAQLGNLCYYLGEDGFYVFDGTNSRPIGVNRVDKTFWTDLDQSYMERVVAAVDPISKVVFWSYPGTGNTAGASNRILAYSWAFDKWSIQQVDCEIIARILSFGFTLDDLPFLSTATVSSEALGTGDGTTTTFSGSLAHQAIQASSLRITAGSVSGTDNGAGVIGGTGVSTGSVTYTGLGQYSITFSSAPPNGTAITAAYTYGSQSLDALPASLDSRLWTGGNVLLAGFNTSHELGFFTGTNLAPTVETTEVEPFPSQGQRVMPTKWLHGMSRAVITSARPAVDGGTPSVALAVRSRLEDAPVYGGAVAINSIGECPQRADGRYVKSQITLPAGSSFTHIQGVELTVSPGGRR